MTSILHRLFFSLIVCALASVVAAPHTSGPDSTAAPHNLLFVTGEFSGEQLAVWYRDKLLKEKSVGTCHGIGGQYLADHGMTVHPEITFADHGFRTTALFQALASWWNGHSLFGAVGDLIEAQKIDQVILVDCPRLNVLLARYLNKRFPTVHLTYLAPPELWHDALWRWCGIGTLNSCDECVVIYPIAQEWYAKFGVTNARYCGSPHLDRLKPYLTEAQRKQRMIAIAAGSRPQELDMMLPWCKSIIEHFKKIDPEIRFVFPFAPTMSRHAVEQQLERHQLTGLLEPIGPDEKSKYTTLAHCCCAISKPGTITLDCALLKVPTVTIVKLSWITYWILKWQFLAPYISLPSHILNKPVFPELIQSDCTQETIIHETERLYNSFIRHDGYYATMVQSCEELSKHLADHSSIRYEPIAENGKPIACQTQ